MLAKRFVVLDLYLARFRTRPLMAVPRVAIHREATLLIEDLSSDESSILF